MKNSTSKNTVIVELSESQLGAVRQFMTFIKNQNFLFKLIDDWLDFQASAEDLGKPSRAADLRLGLATAPGGNLFFY